MRVLVRKPGIGSRGFTLVEVLVGSALMAVLMTMVYQVLSPSMRSIQRAEARVETQQAALLALDRIFFDLRLSDPRSVTLLASPPAIAFLSPRPPSRSGLPPLDTMMYRLAGADTRPVTWRTFEVLYHDADQRLLLSKEAPYPGGFEVALMTPQQVQLLLEDPRYPARVAARNLQIIRFSRPRPPGILVDVVSEVTALGKRRETRLSLQVSPRH